MAGRIGARSTRVAVGTLLALATVGHPGPPVAAADPREPVVLPGSSVVAVVADLDGDGAREVIRIVSSDGASSKLEAWQVVEETWQVIDSTWRAVTSSELPTPGFAGPMTLVPLRVDGEERVLLATSRVDLADAYGQPCCLELHEVSLDAGELSIRPMAASGGPAGQVLAADLDADGTDELVLFELRFTDGDDPAGSETTYLDVLQLTSEGWETRYSTEKPGAGGSIRIGESDGIPGDEILVGPPPSGQVERLTLIDGEVVTDVTSLGTGEDPGGVHGIVDGRIVVGNPGTLEVLRWPRGEAVERIARMSSPSWYSAFVLGAGPEAVVLTPEYPERGGWVEGRMTVHDLALRPLGDVPASALASQLWELLYRPQASGAYNLSRSLDPAIAPVPGGWTDGRHAFINAGVLLRAGGADGFEATPMRTLIGARPVGLAGPDDGWLVTADAMYAAPEGGYLMYGIPPDGPGTVLTPIDGLLRGDEEVEVGTVELRNAVEVASDARVSTLLAHGDGFEATISAPSGSVVVWADGDVWESEVVESGPVTLEVRPPRRASPENRPFERWVLVIAPDGTGTVRQWQGTFLAEPPDLNVTAATEPFSLRSTVAGRVSEAMAVTVDGEPAEVNRFGAFRVAVDAPIWPRSVVVVATDPFGTERTERLEIVGFLDYRGLPWIPMVGLLTVALGLLLFVRTPRHRPLQLAADGDGRLEEIDGDLP
jgi:hypothetical protein